VDRADLAAELDRRAAPNVQRILVQVNCSAEPQKGGVEPASLPELLDQLRVLDHVVVQGLMTMSSLTEDRAEQRRAFRLLRALRDDSERTGHSLPELSMGMSGDYPIAVEEGATMIRFGTVLFGERADD
jgi:pyridoxal phosphate enzyme (YggS family)